MNRRQLFTVAMAIVCIAAVGCQAKLKVSRNYQIPDGTEIAKTLEMDDQPGEQTLKIELKLKAGDPIDLFVLKANEVADVVGVLPSEKKKWEAKALGFKRDMKEGSFTVKIPAKTKYKVIAMQSDSAKQKSEFELSISN